jgi:hypothetical protein
VLQRLEPELPAAGRALKALRVSTSSGMHPAIVEEEGDGYQSPKWVGVELWRRAVDFCG